MTTKKTNEVARYYAEVVSHFAGELISAMVMREMNNRRTAKIHPDPTVRAEAAARVSAYEVARSEITRVADDWLKRGPTRTP